VRVGVAACVVAATVAAAATALNRWYPDWQPMPQGHIARVAVQSSPLPSESVKAASRPVKQNSAPVVEPNRQPNGTPMPIAKDLAAQSAPTTDKPSLPSTDDKPGMEPDSKSSAAVSDAMAKPMVKDQSNLAALTHKLSVESDHAAASANGKASAETTDARSTPSARLTSEQVAAMAIFMGIPKSVTGAQSQPKLTPAVSSEPETASPPPVLPATKETVAAAIRVAAETPDPYRPQSGALSVARIDYDNDGHVVLSGSAQPNKRVRVSLSGNMLGIVTSDADGKWQLIPQKRVDVGRYTLQAEELGDANASTASVQLPFEQAKDLQDLPKDDRWVVQPGNNLWRLSKNFYGAGVLYPIIFDANRDKIDDPDLIYPGQIFRIPSAETASVTNGQQ
jgi:nucleoid-associated protein YgaU